MYDQKNIEDDLLQTRVDRVYLDEKRAIPDLRFRLFTRIVAIFLTISLGSLMGASLIWQVELEGRVVQSFALVALVTSVMVSLIYLPLTRLLRPLNHLAHITKQVALGDFSERIPITHNDELRQLSEQFNEMCNQLQKSQTQLIQAEKLKSAGQMAAGIAHDFNNILFAIGARLELISNDLMAGRLRGKELLKSVEIMQRATADGVETVRKIREISSPKRDHAISTVDLNELARQSLELSQGKRRQSQALHGTQIKVRVLFGEIPPILANPAEIREILINLINNSVDAMPSGGTLIISSAEEEGSVRMTVADTGQGMDESTKAKVLDPFFTTKGVAGTGLGLSMVYGIIKRMKGDIRIESVPNQGTAVSLFLPVKDGLSLVEEKPAETSNDELTRHRILVVDDDPAVGEGLSALLSVLGQETEVADSGNRALDLLREKPFDLVFSDLGMPEMTGWDLSRIIAREWPEIPVILITGWGDYIEESELLSRKVRKILSKPVSSEQLREVLAELEQEQIETVT